MAKTNYSIVPAKNGWGIRQDSVVTGNYLTKEAAFEAAVSAASNAIKEGNAITISLDAAEAGEPALGKS
jgi:hypothetical protein